MNLASLVISFQNTEEVIPGKPVVNENETGVSLGTILKQQGCYKDELLQIIKNLLCLSIMRTKFD